MFQEAYMRKIAALVGVAAIVALGAYTYNAITIAENVNAMPATITVTGEGEVFARPDLASFTFSVSAKEATAPAAQERSATAVNAIVEYLKGKGVEDRDIKTEYYNLNPVYEYPDTRCTEWGCPPMSDPKIVGYDALQTIKVRVRNTNDSGMLISGIGELGATNISGLSFTIDDEDAFKAQAREAAIADAKEKAEKLASQLGVRIVRMTWYSENDYGYPMMYGMGGDMMAKAESFDSMAVTPSMPTGENTFTASVSITYEVK